MVPATGVLDAINMLLVGRWPDRTVYVNLSKQDFERPSFSIDYISSEGRTANTRYTKDITDYYTIRCFIETDEYHEQEALALMELQHDVVLLFDAGYIAVGDRAVKAIASTGGDNPGEAYVDLTVTYKDDSAEPRKEHVPMEDIRINYNDKED